MASCGHWILSLTVLQAQEYLGAVADKLVSISGMLRCIISADLLRHQRSFVSLEISWFCKEESDVWMKMIMMVWQ